jgi:hypothetical protein
MPKASAKILATVGYNEARAQAGIPFAELAPNYALKAGTKLLPLEPLFPRVEG